MTLAVPVPAPSRDHVVLTLGRVAAFETGGERRAVDAYRAVAELGVVPRDAGVTLVLSLADLPQGHAAIVRAAKRVRPDVDVLLAACEGRPALFGQLVAHGANGMIGPGGEVHRFDEPPRQPPPHRTHAEAETIGPGLLSPEELAALLADDDEPTGT